MIMFGRGTGEENRFHHIIADWPRVTCFFGVFHIISFSVKCKLREKNVLIKTQLAAGSGLSLGCEMKKKHNCYFWRTSWFKKKKKKQARKNTCMILGPESLSPRFGEFLDTFTACLSLLVNVFELQSCREKSVVSWLGLYPIALSPEQRGYYSAYLMMNDPCFSTFARCLDSQQLLAQFPT